MAVCVDGNRHGGEVVVVGGCDAVEEVARGSGKAMDARGVGEAGEDFEGWPT